MQTTLKTKNLKAALATIAPACMLRGTLPILSMIKLVATKDSVRVSATDLEISISEEVKEAETKEAGACTVALQLFSSFLGKITSSSVSLQLVGSELIVAAGENESRFETLPAEEFPPELELKKAVEFTATLDSFIRPLQRVAFVASTEQARYTLNGVSVEAKEKEVFFVATDGKRFAKIALPFSAKPFSIIVPNNFVSAIIRSAAEEPLEVFVTERSLRVVSGTVDIRGQLIEGNFPNWRQVVPEKKGSKVFSLNRLDFLEALSVANLFANKSAPTVQLEGSKKSIVVKCGKQSKTRLLSAELGGAPSMSIGFNGPWMAQYMTELSEETVRLHMEDEVSAIMIEEDSLLLIMMPMRSDCEAN